MKQVGGPLSVCRGVQRGTASMVRAVSSLPIVLFSGCAGLGSKFFYTPAATLRPVLCSMVHVAMLGGD